MREDQKTARGVVLPTTRMQTKGLCEGGGPRVTENRNVSIPQKAFIAALEMEED